MNKKRLAYAIIAIFCVATLAHTWLLNDDNALPSWAWILLLMPFGWAMWTIRDRPDPKSKSFDFNPKRGAAYFLFGLVIFPVSALFDAAFGADLSLGAMAAMTLFGSILAGIAGTFTENIGI